MTEIIAAPKGMITIESFSKSSGILESKVIDMIKGGFYTGKIVDGTWFINETEQSGVKSKQSSNSHPHQSDLDKAQSALTVGSSLSAISTFVHILLIIVLFVTNSALNQPVNILLIFGVSAGLLASWAIIHALLSIVVTNALTAKYMIYQSSKK